MSEVKIILLCGGKFAIPTLKELAFFNMLAAVVIPKHCSDMIEETDALFSPTGIPVLEVTEDTYAADISEAITEFGANLGLILTFTYLLPSSVYTLPEKGFYNIHPGPLPTYKGPDPVFWQIKNREKYAAVTMHSVEESFDAGAVVMEERVMIETSDTYGTLNSKLAAAAARLSRTLIKLISLDLSVPSKKQDIQKAKYYRRQKEADVVIDWDIMQADDIIALMNACNPWNKGAITRIGDKIIRVLHAEKAGYTANEKVRPGTILTIDENEIIVNTTGGEALKINFVYTDEGFVRPLHLMKLGISKGIAFENISSKNA